MENATKALLIAGSVLIAILLIAMGVKIFNSTSGTTQSAQSTMDATSVAMFNNKWYKYVGTNKSKSTAISLLNEVLVNNSTNSNRRVYVTFTKDGTTSGALYTSSHLTGVINGNTYKTSFANKSTFTIEVATDSDGYVNLIRIL